MEGRVTAGEGKGGWGQSPSVRSLMIHPLVSKQARDTSPGAATIRCLIFHIFCGVEGRREGTGDVTRLTRDVINTCHVTKGRK